MIYDILCSLGECALTLAPIALGYAVAEYVDRRSRRKKDINAR